ncbi:hypothetical protein ACWD4L_15285 [Streptomyces sp. NPDC002596]
MNEQVRRVLERCRVGRYVSAGRRVQELVVPKGGGRTDGFTP